MLRANNDFEFLVDSITQLVVWDHTADSTLKQKLRATLTHFTRCFYLLITYVTSVTCVDLFALFVTTKDNFFSVDDDDIVTSINVRSEDWLVLATELVRCLNGNLTENLVLGIDDVPLALDVLCFS